MCKPKRRITQGRVERNALVGAQAEGFNWDKVSWPLKFPIVEPALSYSNKKLDLDILPPVPKKIRVIVPVGIR